jgi:hypothetical protein
MTASAVLAALNARAVDGLVAMSMGDIDRATGVGSFKYVHRLLALGVIHIERQASHARPAIYLIADPTWVEPPPRTRWTPERLALLREIYPTLGRCEELAARLSALPGPRISADLAKRQASHEGIKRGPKQTIVLPGGKIRKRRVAVGEVVAAVNTTGTCRWPLVCGAPASGHWCGRHAAMIGGRG